MIDINKPVPEGEDFVLNLNDGSQELGTAEEFAQLKAAGVLSGVHTDVVPAMHNEPNVAAPAEPEPAPEPEPKKPEAPAPKKSK